MSVEPRHVARIDLEAIRHNTRVLLTRAQGRPLLADVSADAYGHGAHRVAQSAVEAGASVLGVTNPWDVDALRRIEADRYVLPGLSRMSASGDYVVAGAQLYGLGNDPQLKPAMTVSSTVVATKTIAAGEGVSYGYTYRASAATNLALVGIGYADGVDRSAGNLASVSLRGRARLVAGRVAMNALVLELGDDAAEVGDEAVFFGDAARGEPGVEDWAASLGRPASEVVAVFGNRLPRVYA
ncbi:alanine racemase C-terminal domain-containing protein [Glaciihabitans sp. UYNi722]|uniref:alanine racemase C-terminal domain-containing protein n=1 Tax=Glaciihabitans sp. UYNi722 TaxID=3156344 RepID=UPI0033963990